MAEISRGALVALPAGYQPCAGCNALDKPLAFRGSVRLFSVILLARESRKAGYSCEECARRQTAGSLAFTGLLGWWGIFSLIFYAPRATYHNWRAVWKPPRRPLDWGALDASSLAQALAGRKAAL